MSRPVVGRRNVAGTRSTLQRASRSIANTGFYQTERRPLWQVLRTYATRAAARPAVAMAWPCPWECRHGYGLATAMAMQAVSIFGILFDLGLVHCLFVDRCVRHWWLTPKNTQQGMKKLD